MLEVGFLIIFLCPSWPSTVSVSFVVAAFGRRDMVVEMVRLPLAAWCAL